MDITPKLGSVLAGSLGPRYAEDVSYPLYASAVVFDDGERQVAYVQNDLIVLTREQFAVAKARAQELTGIPPEQMMMSCTHTHYGPATYTMFEVAAEEDYVEWVLPRIGDAVKLAQNRLQPAVIAHTSGSCPEETHNRRWWMRDGSVQMNPAVASEELVRPAGPTDPEVALLIAETPEGQPIAAIANYSLHYVGGVPEGMISADYFGEFARLMHSRAGGEDFVAMMSNGTSGDINNISFLVARPPRKPFEQIQIVAQKAAETAWRAHATIEAHRQDARLGMIQREVTLKRRRPTDEQMAAAKAVLAVKDEAERDKLPRLAEAYAHRILSAAEASETVTVPVQALGIGELAVCAIPFETFAEIGLDLKRRSPFPRTMVISIANGTNGYLPTPEQHELGGYETWLGTNRVQEDASVILTDNLLEMLAELQKSSPESAAH